MGDKRDEFPPKVRKTVAERAGYLCSNPFCNTLTIGPCEADEEISSNKGVAAHICAARANGPRYDINQSVTERKSISNAIWLCGSCSILIDKNDGVDYPKELLQDWKKNHVRLIKNNLEGADKIVFNGNLKQEELDMVRKVVAYLEDRGMLFVEVVAENVEHVILSIREIRTYLTQIKANIKGDSEILDHLVSNMTNECRKFMNSTSTKSNTNDFCNNLAILRKSMGIYLLEMKKHYGVTIGEPLNTILPK